MRNYYRIILGKNNVHAEDAYKGNFIGANFGIHEDLTSQLPDNRPEFNKIFIHKLLEAHPKSKIAAGLACGMLYTIAKGIVVGDVILCPDGQGNYYVGEVVGDYEYHPEEILPHRRAVQWFDRIVPRSEMSESLQNSTGSIATVCNVSQYAKEIELLIKGSRPAAIITTDETIEDPNIFALEKHLEDFLVHNWQSTELGKKYDIYEEDGERVGQQYPSDTGPIDILALSKDKKEIVVVELKKGRASDVVVGQIQRYMGYAKEELAESDQKVRGIIIGFEDDAKIRRALSVARDIELYTYKIDFQLQKIAESPDL